MAERVTFVYNGCVVTVDRERQRQALDVLRLTVVDSRFEVWVDNGRVHVRDTQPGIPVAAAVVRAVQRERRRKQQVLDGKF